MSHRGNESGMDFEWNNRTGPMDGRSPFAHVSQNAQRFPAGTPSGKSKLRATWLDRSTASKCVDKDVVGSPQKSHNSPAKFPAMSNSPTKPLPPTPAYNGLFSTPRKSNNNTDYDDSSAGETPKSPEEKTPDTMGRSMLSNANETMEKSMFTKQLQPWDGNMGPTQAGAERSPTKEKEKPQAPARRESWMVRLKNRINSPGRGEIARADHEKRISKKSRSRELQRHVSKRRRHSVSDSEGDDERKSRRERKDKKGDSSEKKPHWISSTFTFIAQHPTVPHILSFYAQLIFNVFLLAGCAYLIYCFWSAVSGDVDKKSHEAMADIMAEMAACAEQYTTNKCDRATRAPALETVCENWSKCMNRDPSKVGRARVSAHTFAEIFNSFVEPISWKAMVSPSFPLDPLSFTDSSLIDLHLPPRLRLLRYNQHGFWIFPGQNFEREPVLSPPTTSPILPASNAAEEFQWSKSGWRTTVLWDTLESCSGFGAAA